jgi:DNA-binding IclR family transcriptional regulator
LDSQILDFIRSSVKTVWSLELLLFMRRNRTRTWTTDELIRELRSSRNIVTDAIAVFVQAGILREDESGFRYEPATAEFDTAVEQLANEYAERPTTVVNAIVDAQSNKLQDFANAFRIKRD